MPVTQVRGRLGNGPDGGRGDLNPGDGGGPWVFERDEGGARPRPGSGPGVVDIVVQSLTAPAVTPAAT